MCERKERRTAVLDRVERQSAGDVDGEVKSRGRSKKGMDYCQGQRNTLTVMSEQEAADGCWYRRAVH